MTSTVAVKRGSLYWTSLGFTYGGISFDLVPESSGRQSSTNGTLGPGNNYSTNYQRNMCPPGCEPTVACQCGCFSYLCILHNASTVFLNEEHMLTWLFWISGAPDHKQYFHGYEGQVLHDEVEELLS